MEECDFNKWVDGLAIFLKEQRHGANIAVLIHYGPGGVEAMYSTPDAVTVEGMLKIATMALDSQVKSSLGIKVQESRNSEAAEQIFKDKLKVN